MIALTVSPAVLLLFLRTFGLFTSAPIFSSPLVPIPLRVALAGLLSFVAAGYLPPMHPQLLLLLVLGAKELLVGLAIGFVAQLPFYIAQIAGSLVDLESGLSAAQLLAPGHGQPVSLIGTTFIWLTIALFVIMGGLRWLVADLILGIGAVPLGSIHLSAGLVATLLHLTGGIFASGLMLSLPALVTVILMNLVLGVLARVSPQINPLSLGLGIGPALAIGAVLLSVPILAGLLQMLLQQSFAGLPSLFRMFGP